MSEHLRRVLIKLFPQLNYTLLHPIFFIVLYADITEWITEHIVFVEGAEYITKLLTRLCESMICTGLGMSTSGYPEGVVGMIEKLPAFLKSYGNGIEPQSTPSVVPINLREEYMARVLGITLRMCASIEVSLCTSELRPHMGSERMSVKISKHNYTNLHIPDSIYDRKSAVQLLSPLRECLVFFHRLRCGDVTTSLDSVNCDHPNGLIITSNKCGRLIDSCGWLPDRGGVS